MIYRDISVAACAMLLGFVIGVLVDPWGNTGSPSDEKGKENTQTHQTILPTRNQGNAEFRSEKVLVPLTRGQFERLLPHVKTAPIADREGRLVPLGLNRAHAVLVAIILGLVRIETVSC